MSPIVLRSMDIMVIDIEGKIDNSCSNGPPSSLPPAHDLDQILLGACMYTFPPLEEMFPLVYLQFFIGLVRLFGSTSQNVCIGNFAPGLGVS